MEDLQKLSDSEVLMRLEKGIVNERKLLTEILHLLREAERRQLYAQHGYPSLFEFATTKLGYSSGAAFRRIEAMRLIRDLPEVEEKILSGEISLTAAALTQSHFKSKKSQSPASLEEKRGLIKTIENKSAREVEKILNELTPQQTRRERVRNLGKDRTEMRLEISTADRKRLENLKARFSHKNPKMSWAELIMELAGLAEEKFSPKSNPKTESKQRSSAPATQTTSAPKTILRVPRATKRLVFQKAGTQCSYVSPLTGRQCQSRHLLEIDHIKPRSLGGDNSLSNLRVLCRNHNILMATQKLGIAQMQRFVPSLR